MKHMQLRRPSVWVALLAIALFIFHPFWLRMLAWPIARGDSLPDRAVTVILPRSAKLSPAAFTLAVAQLQQSLADSATRPDTVYVFHDYVRRAEACGADASFVDGAVARLQDLGVPASAIQVIGGGQSITDAEVVTEVGRWLQGQSDGHYVLATNAFESGRYYALANQHLDTDTRRRLHVVGFARHGIGPRTWWRSAAGLKNWISETGRLFHLWCFGDPRPNLTWTPESYQQYLNALPKQQATD